jgi:hypothetical protein
VICSASLGLRCHHQPRRHIQVSPASAVNAPLRPHLADLHDDGADADHLGADGGLQVLEAPQELAEDPRVLAAVLGVLRREQPPQQRCT